MQKRSYLMCLAIRMKAYLSKYRIPPIRVLDAQSLRLPYRNVWIKGCNNSIMRLRKEVNIPDEHYESY